MNKQCPEGKILNPASKRCVKRDGAIGKKILLQTVVNLPLVVRKQCPEDKILNPITNNCVLKRGKIGKMLIQQIVERMTKSPPRSLKTIKKNMRRYSSHESMNLARSLSSGKVIRLKNRYVVGKRLGSGSFGAVYKALDDKTGKTVAIKFFKHGKDDESINKEISALFHIRDICQDFICIIDSGRMNRFPYIVMTYLQGPTLAKYVGRTKTRGKFFENAELLYQKLSEQLKKIHRLGLAHQDVKESNIVMRSSTEPVHVDFGLLCHTPECSPRGTFWLMSPQKIEARMKGKKVPLRIVQLSDFYALAMFFEQIFVKYGKLIPSGLHKEIEKDLKMLDSKV